MRLGCPDCVEYCHTHVGNHPSYGFYREWYCPDCGRTEISAPGGKRVPEPASGLRDAEALSAELRLLVLIKKVVRYERHRQAAEEETRKEKERQAEKEEKETNNSGVLPANKGDQCVGE